MGTVWTNGCFDGLHHGHLSLLQEARAQGEFLIVAINTDESIRRLKGQLRPINKLSVRYAALLPYVDRVLVFEEERELIRLIRIIRPAVLIKGEDSLEAGPIPGADLLPQWGGRLHLARYIPGFSTTAISGVPKEKPRPPRKGPGSCHATSMDFRFQKSESLSGD